MNHFYTEDPLWDGTGCLADNNCCTKAIFNHGSFVNWSQIDKMILSLGNLGCAPLVAGLQRKQFWWNKLNSTCIIVMHEHIILLLCRTG